MISVGYGPLRDGTGQWQAFLPHPTDPTRDIVAAGDSGDAVCAAFVDAYNAATNSALVAADFTFYRQVKVEAEEYVVPEGIQCIAYPGDRAPIAVTAATQPAAEELFMSTFNTTMGTDFEPFEFRFTPNTRAMQD
jgi:hypothetical protein